MRHSIFSCGYSCKALGNNSAFGVRCFVFTASTVVLNSVKEDWQAVWTIAKFGPWPSRNHLTDQNQIWRDWLCSRVIQTCKVWLGTNKRWRLHEYLKYTRTVNSFMYWTDLHAQWLKRRGFAQGCSLLRVRIFKNFALGSFPLKKLPKIDPE